MTSYVSIIDGPKSFLFVGGRGGVKVLKPGLKGLLSICYSDRVGQEVNIDMQNGPFILHIIVRKVDFNLSCKSTFFLIICTTRIHLNSFLSLQEDYHALAKIYDALPYIVPLAVGLPVPHETRAGLV